MHYTTGTRSAYSFITVVFKPYIYTINLCIYLCIPTQHGFFLELMSSFVVIWLRTVGRWQQRWRTMSSDDDNDGPAVYNSYHPSSSTDCRTTRTASSFLRQCSLRNAEFLLRVICRTLHINNSANYTFSKIAFSIIHLPSGASTSSLTFRPVNFWM